MSRSIQPSWFEALTAAAFWFFRERNVDVAVIEVGMLGRWDATNVLDAKLSIVTNVDLDHIEYAGPTREAIAREKSGIIRKGATLVLGETDPALLPIFEEQQPGRVLLLGRDIGVGVDDSNIGGRVTITTPWSVYDDIPNKLQTGVQTVNTALALTAVEAFREAPLGRAAAARALNNISLPGRFETVRRSPLVIVDTAHNEAAALALQPLIDQQIPETRRRVLMCGLTGDHDPLKFLTNIGADRFDEIVVTRPDTPRAIPISETAFAAAKFVHHVHVCPEWQTALKRVMTLAGEHGAALIVGSHYLIAPVRHHLLTIPR
jgi:dihydrofolate synthase / folylpolyglutamate synthase